MLCFLPGFLIRILGKDAFEERRPWKSGMGRQQIQIHSRLPSSERKFDRIKSQISEASFSEERKTGSRPFRIKDFPMHKY